MSKRHGPKIKSRNTACRQARLHTFNNAAHNFITRPNSSSSSESEEDMANDFQYLQDFEDQFQVSSLPCDDHNYETDIHILAEKNFMDEELPIEKSTLFNQDSEEIQPHDKAMDKEVLVAEVPGNVVDSTATAEKPALNTEGCSTSNSTSEGVPVPEVEIATEECEDIFDQFEELASNEGYSSPSDNDDEPQIGPTDQPLFANSNISLVDSVLAILTLAYKFKLSGECLVAVLHLISLHCPRPNLCVKSLYSLKKFFVGMTAPIMYHYYCSNCNSLLSDKTAICENCPAGTFKLGHFIEMSVVHQLESLFKRESFYSDLQYRFHRRKHNPQGIEDIYDGNIYKKLFENNGFLNNPNNISFMWYTDGVPLYKSSKYSIWPLYFVINELPYTKRTLPENIIIAGLWFGSSKPDGNTFLMPVYNTLSSLYTGIQVSVPDVSNKITIRCRLLCGTCDLPAKCVLFNSVQFNGAYGCPRCLQKGERYTLGARGGVHVYPFEDEVEMRTHEDTLHNSVQALNTGEPVFGVKGPCVLARLVPDMIRSTAVDVMHSLYLGITKRLLYLWFDSSFSKFPFSLSLMINVIDKRLCAIRPPNFVPRTPRSIKDHLCYWKASELKAWLFYYSIPVLFGIMDNAYLMHHIQLVLAMFLLNQRSISQQQIDLSEKLIISYVQSFQTLYGLRFMSANLHQLLHYVDTIRDLGPLWVSSCFPFEDLNGKITRLVHGTRYAELQICSSVSYIQNLPYLINGIDKNCEAYTFCHTLNAKSLPINEKICENISSIGSYKHLLPVPLRIAEALYNADIMIGTGNCQMFKRLQKKNSLYCSKAYTNVTNTLSYCVLYGENRNAALIECFVRWSRCKCECLCKCDARYFAILSLHDCVDLPDNCNTQGLDMFFVKCMSPKHQFLAVPVQDILSLCFCIAVNDELYCVLPVNDIEVE